MAWTSPSDPVTSTVITVAYAVANLLTQIRWLRLLTGNADPPGSAYVVVSDSTSTTSWRKVPGDALATDSVDNRVLADGAVSTTNIQNAVIGSQQITTTPPFRIANANLEDDIVNSRVLADGAVSTANIQNGAIGSQQITTTPPFRIANANLEDDIVNDRVLAPGAAAANLGFTPINKGGDSGIATLGLASGQVVYWPQEVGQKLRLTPDQAYVLGVASNVHYLRTPGYVGFVNSAASPTDWSLLHDTVNHILYVHGSQVWTAAHFSQPTVTPGAGRVPISDASGTLDAWVTGGGGGGTGTPIPPGLIAAVATAAAIPTGWVRYSAADGRLLVGAGTVGENTYSENSSYGSSWAHGHTSPAHGHTSPSHGHTGDGHAHSGAGLGVGGTIDASSSGLNGRFTAGGANALPDNHTHAFTLDVSGNVDATTSTVQGTVASIDGTAAGINGTTLLLPSRAVVWVQKV
jgi:hypothetical protein